MEKPLVFSSRNPAEKFGFFIFVYSCKQLQYSSSKKHPPLSRSLFSHKYSHFFILPFIHTPIEIDVTFFINNFCCGNEWEVDGKKKSFNTYICLCDNVCVYMCDIKTIYSFIIFMSENMLNKDDKDTKLSTDILHCYIETITYINHC